MKLFIEPLQKEFRKNSDAEAAKQMSAYMKNKFLFFGVKTPLRKKIAKQFYKENGIPACSDSEWIILKMFEMPEREFQYTAIELCGKYKKHWTADKINFFERIILKRSWWDSVDSIKSICLKPYFLEFPDDRYEITQRWIDSDNIWLQRLSVIFQLNFGEKTDADLLARNIFQLKDSDEFFVQKAIGWALRDYARIDPAFVTKFVNENELKPLSKREALKNLSI